MVGEPSPCASLPSPPSRLNHGACLSHTGENWFHNLIREKHLTFWNAVLVLNMELVFLILVKKFDIFCNPVFFLIQPHQSSWCSLVLPYVQVNKLVLVNQWKKLGNVSPVAPLLGRPPPPHPDPRPLHLPPRQHLLGSHNFIPETGFIE